MQRSLCFDEPTRGIDVGARSGYNVMNSLVKRETGVRYHGIFSGNAWGLGMSDRVIVMRGGSSQK